MRLLLVEDETKLAAVIKKALEQQAGYTVDVAVDGQEGLIYVSASEYDFIVLDLMLPKKSGMEVLREIRARKIKTPVLLLTAKDSVESKVTGLENGADDYLTKPFDLRELIARIRARLRRSREEQSVALTAGDLELDPATHKARRGNRELKLTAREFDLLEYLLRKKNRVVTRDQIVDQVWSGGSEGASNIVDVYINYLRAKIDQGKSTKLIQTVWGVGYILRDGEGE